MVDKLRSLFSYILFRKEGETMMAMLWAQKIMSMDTVEAPRATYARGPRLLKVKVKAILIEFGMEELTEEA